MDYERQIVDYIQKNRVSTTEVADALAKTGVLEGVSPVTQDHFKVGPVRCIFAANESNASVHEQVRAIQPGEVAIVFTHNCNNRAVLGDLVAKFILLYQGAAALVVDGYVRDAASLRRNRFEVWSKGATPLGCFNSEAPGFPEDRAAELRRMYEGGVAVCDDGGITVVPKHKLTADTLERLHRIELQEDVWFYCLDVLKWDTKRIVCDKEYLTRPEHLPAAFSEHRDVLATPLETPTKDD